MVFLVIILIIHRVSNEYICTGNNIVIGTDDKQLWELYRD